MVLMYLLLLVPHAPKVGPQSSFSFGKTVRGGWSCGWQLFLCSSMLLMMLSCGLQESAREEKKWATDLESMEKHKRLLEKRVTEGYDDAMEQLKAVQQQ